MKKSILALVALFMLAFNSKAQSGREQTSFKVYGNCGMCERKIEGAVNEQQGVFSADWNVESKKMTIKYDSKQITLDELKQLIADVGYDSDSHRSTDKKYNSLHGCCQYDRPE
ncbi:MAG: heavy-metal-associated domain-containing protein [Crocinitomicaceae bacterium]|nr:heavy-metal-associated domain-containing protein [Crocinitomicaceae bacterium]MDG1776140.1 heavy-metal-associated domain-containing protein [Crocinitomicaceae bacterium]